MKISIMWLIAILLIIVMGILIQMTQKKLQMNKDKWTQFECGFNTMNPSHLPFSFQFFLVAILFLIFDIEISMILAYPLEPTTTKNLMMITVFLMVLTIGLLYEWQNSKIDWSDWMGMVFCKN